ncbi:RNA polymerase sigma factor [Acinetobacter puyangensis]|uniref:RNA polymerase sigma factor n=1 Tax=Acinetobacter puyangensis TaxID=1096779 RepID=UPI003A4DC96A
MGFSSDPINESFSRIYTENYHWLSQWLSRQLKNKANLEDIVQDTFLKLFTAKTAHLIKEPRAYLATTARCIFIDQVRHQVVEKRYLEYLQQNEQELQVSPEQTVMMLELLHRMTLAVSDLPERQRLCLLMYYLEGLAQEKIAEQLKVSRRTVQLDLVKAMVYCHQWMQQH